MNNPRAFFDDARGTSTTAETTTTANKVARASAAARGVSFIFGRFFAPSPGMFVICEVFVNNRKFWCFGKPAACLLGKQQA